MESSLNGILNAERIYKTWFIGFKKAFIAIIIVFNIRLLLF